MSQAKTIQLPAVDHLPWPFAAASVVAMSMLLSTSLQRTEFPSVPLFVPLIILLLASYLSRRRLSRDRVFRWVIRVAPMTAIVLLVGIPEKNYAPWYLDPAYTNLVGFLLAAELVIRAWERPDPAKVRTNYGIVLFTTAMVMTNAANSWNRTAMQWFAPAYFLCALLCMRSFSTLGIPLIQSGGERHRGSLTALRIAAMLIALGLGFSGVYSVTRLDSTFVRWASEILQKQKARRAEIGLSNAPQLRGTFNPTASASRVMLIDGPRGERHLRAAAFDTYRNGQWKPSIGERSFEPVELAALRTAGAGDRLRVTRLGDTFGLLPAPLQAQSVEPLSDVDSDAGGALRDHGASSGRYDLTVPKDERAQGPLCLPLGAADRATMLQQPPEIDGKVGELAKQVAGEGSQAEKLIRIGLHLNSKHAYSLSFEPNGEPITDFILNGKAAHCQYFASAYVIMARAVGIPARYVAGYYAHESYGDDQTVVRDRDAHAWAECYLDGVGWLTVDATPASGLPNGLFPNASWIQRLWERVADLPRVIRYWLTEEGGNQIVVTTVLSAFAVGATIYFLRMFVSRRIARRKSLGGYAAPGEELAAIGKRFEKFMTRRGISFAATRTWRDHLEQPDPARAALIDATACRSFITLYDVARFGGRTSGELAQLRHAIGALEQSQLSQQ